MISIDQSEDSIAHRAVGDLGGGALPVSSNMTQVQPRSTRLEINLNRQMDNNQFLVLGG